MECTECNLIMRVLTICHVKLTQRTALELKPFDLRSLSPALRNLWLLLLLLLLLIITVAFTEVGGDVKKGARPGEKKCWFRKEGEVVFKQTCTWILQVEEVMFVNPHHRSICKPAEM